MRSVGTSADWEEPSGNPAASPRNDGLPGLIDIGRAGAFLRAEAPTILVTAAVVFSLGMAGWAVWPAKYTASALVMVDPRTARVTGGDEVLPGIGGDSAAIASIADIATSDGALLPIVRAEKLAQDSEFAGTSLFGGAAPGEGDIVATLRKSLKVTRRGLTYVIEVSMTAKDADKAARLANAVAKDIVDRQSATRVNASSNASGALEGRLADLRATALASEKAVSDYRMSHGLLDVSPDSTVGQRRLASLTQQAATVRGRLEEAKARYDELRRLKAQDIAGTSAPRSELLATLRSQYSDEKRQAAELTRTFGPRHPRVDASQERVTVLEEQIRTETARLIEQAKSELDTLTKQNAALEAELAKRTNAELAMNQDEVVLRDLMRQADADRQLYEQFLARQKSTHEQSNLTRPETEVVSKALPPSKSNRLALPLVAPVAAFAGLAAGVLAAMLRRRRDGEPARAALIEPRFEPAPRAARPAPTTASRPTPRAGDVVVEAIDPATSFAAVPEPYATPRTVVEEEPVTTAAAAKARKLRRRATPLDADRVFAELGTPVVADLAALPPMIGRGRNAARDADDVDLAVVDARPAMLPFAETFFPHLKTRPGQALIVADVPGAVGRTTMALAIGRMAEAVGMTALVVTDHGEAREVRPSLCDLLDDRLDLERLPPPETLDRVSVMSFDGHDGRGFWDVAEDERLPDVLERLTRAWDLVILEGEAPAASDRAATLSASDVLRAVLLVADRGRNTLDDVAESAEFWSGDHERLVMIGLNRPDAA